MKKLILLLSLCLFIGKSYAQEECGFDKIINIQKQNDPEYVNYIMQVNDAIQHYNNDEQARAISANATYIIPVVVHIVLDPSNPINNSTVSYAQVQSQIDALNAAFARDGLAYNGQAPGPQAWDTKIQFCLAKTAIGPLDWANTSEPGVMRYDDAVNSQNQMTALSTNDLMNLTNDNNWFPFDKFLNIWVVNSIDGNCSGIQGYSINPLGLQFGLNGFNIDGVVIRADAFGDNSPPLSGNSFVLQPHNLYGSSCPTAFAQRNQGKVLVHEVGHYLNLWHTFQNDINTGASCAGGGAACDLEGDFCCDTPPSNVSSTFICGSSIPSSCGAVPDMVENYMYYATDPCWNTFTEKQTERMVAYLNLFRTNLFSTSNLVATGLIGLNGCLGQKLLADFTYNPNSLCLNTAITFNPIPSPSNTATSWSWTFSGGSIGSSTTQNPVVTFASAGSYVVTLTVNDGVNPSVVQTQTISVTPCALNPDFIHNAQWYFGQHASIDFTSGNPIATSIARLHETVFGSEGAYSYSDNNGNLVFYTDGVNIWNNLHQQINTSPVFNFSALVLNSATSTVQPTNSINGIMGAPFPNHPNMYYIFAPNSTENGLGPLRFVILDLNTNSVGLSQDLPIPLGQKVCESMTIIPHCNGVDYWIISHQNEIAEGEDGYFYVYLLSQFGISSNMITCGPFNYEMHRGGAIKGSPDNQRIAISCATGINPANEDIAIYDFNNGTGVISNEHIFDRPGGSQFLGCSFSQNSQQIYATCLIPKIIIQFDLTGASDPIGGPQFYSPAYMQLGPDNNIYFGVTKNPYSTLVSAISNPNIPHNFQVFASPVNFSTVDPDINILDCGLPKLMDGIQPSYTPPSFNVIYTSCLDVNFNINSCWGGYNYAWDFGDGSGSASGSSASHTYSAAGTYTVICTLTIPGGTGSITTQQIVNILNPSVSIAGSNSVCRNNTTPYIYNVPFVNGAAYNWTVSANGTILGANNSTQVNVQWTSGNIGSISVTITKDGCTSNGTLSINIQSPISTITSAGPCTGTSCDGTASVSSTGGSAPYTYIWNESPVQTGNTANNLCSGVHIMTTTDANGCSAATQYTVNIVPCGIYCTDLSNITILHGTYSNAVTIPTGSLVDVQGTFFINNNITYNAVKFRMAKGSKIIVMPTATLTLKSCTLFSCTDMWEGIEIQGATATLICNRNTRIEDAMMGVNSIAGGKYNITNTTFNKNHTGIEVGTYSSPHTGLVKSCFFECQTSSTSPGATLKSPYLNTVSRFGVEVIDNNNVTVGEAGNANKQNEFRFIDIGIHSQNSTTTVYNNYFHDLKRHCIQTPGDDPCQREGWGIWASSRGRLYVGDISGTQNFNNTFSNTFQNSDGGIFAEVHVNQIKIYKNKFEGIGAQANPSPNNKAVYIVSNYDEVATCEVQNNKFKDNYIGIQYQNNKFHFGTITNNKINNSNQYGIYCLQNTNGGSYQHMLNVSYNALNDSVLGESIYGIVVQNAITTSNAQVTIESNSIKKIDRAIWVINSDKVQVINHSSAYSAIGSAPAGIIFPNAPVPTSIHPHHGIRVERAAAAAITENNVQKQGGNPTAAYLTFSYGITSAYNNGASVINNTVQRMGTGLNFFGTTNTQTVGCNGMYNNRVGLAQDNTFIGAQGDPATAQDNQWTLPNNTGGNIWVSASKVPSSGSSPIFYTRSFSLPFMSPTTFPIMQPTQAVIPQLVSGNPAYTCTFGCANTPCMSTNLAKIAKRQLPFNTLPPEEQLIADFTTLQIIKANDSLTLPGQPEADVLLAFKDSLLNTNTGLLQTFAEKISEGDSLAAKQALLAVVPNYSPEENAKIVDEIYYNTWAKDIFIFNPEDSTRLMDVAQQWPLKGGMAVYDARVMLGYWQDDFTPYTEDNNARMMNTSETTSNEISDNFGILYPNPAQNEVNYEISLQDNETGMLLIYDVTGKLIGSEKLNSGENKANINASEWSNGIYLYRLLINNESKASNSFIINK